ncbi:MAG TPA: hypothetical protein VGA08_00135 [Candidatus Saccharimonadales bacterium]
MNPFTWIKNQSIFSDRRALWLLMISATAMLYIVVFSVLNIESREFKVPVRYSGYAEGNLSNRGEWYSLYSLPLFALLTFLINTVLSLKVHKMRPELSHGLMTLNLVVAVLIYIISRALFKLL